MTALILMYIISNVVIIFFLVNRLALSFVICSNTNLTSLLVYHNFIIQSHEGISAVIKTVFFYFATVYFIYVFLYLEFIYNS